MRPAGFIIDVPVTLSVAVRKQGLTAAEAKRIAREYAMNQITVPQDIGFITEVSLESSLEESCDVIDELEAE